MTRLLCSVVLAACSYPPLPNPGPDAPPDRSPSLELLAGTIGGPGNLDGKGPGARFSVPHGVAIDPAGNLYVADTDNHTVRKVTPDGGVTTIAGSAGVCGSTDGAAAAARLCEPSSVAVDDLGNVYVADTSNRTIRKIAPSGMVGTVAGMTQVTGSADGTGAAASFGFPQGIAVDGSGTVYVADTDNHVIREITASGVVTTLAGTAGAMGSADGTGAAASFNFPQGIAVDGSGTVYVADTNNSVVRKITSSGVVTTLAGSAGMAGTMDGLGTAARFRFPAGISVDGAGNVYVADTFGNTIRMIAPGGNVTTLAGGSSGSLDGTGGAAQFASPSGVAVGSGGDLYVADTGNHTVRKVTAAGVVSTLAGLSGLSDSVDGDGPAARFNAPWGLAADGAGHLYVADRQNDTIRKITLTGTDPLLGTVTTVAGVAGDPGSLDGAGSAARFDAPQGIAVDRGGKVYVADADETIRTISPGGTVTTLAGVASSIGSGDGAGMTARFHFPRGVTVDGAGNVYIADAFNATIRQISPAGSVTTLAGTAGMLGNRDGMGPAARFSDPTAVAVDRMGTIYVADTGNSMIRKITAGVVQTLAGGAMSGSTDGPGATARFNQSQGIATDDRGNVYVADTGNSVIRKITPDGTVTTVAGVPGHAGIVTGDHPGLAAPLALAVVDDSLVIVDTNAILLLRHGAR